MNLNTANSTVQKLGYPFTDLLPVSPTSKSLSPTKIAKNQNCIYNPNGTGGKFYAGQKGKETSLDGDIYENGSHLGPYIIEKTLGQGSYGKVKLAKHRETNEKVALKFIHKSSIKKESHLVRIRREIRLLSLLSHQNHPNIIRLHFVHETALDIILVMEVASGGELLEYIHVKGYLHDEEAKRIFIQILAAVKFMHEHYIVHRDLKPQNLLFSHVHERNATIKLVDFGFSNTYDEYSAEPKSPFPYLNTYCGSPYYASPEMIGGIPYIGPEVDIWSLGVILYSMVVGHVPFNDENIKGLYIKIQACRYEFPKEPIKFVGKECKDLIKKMLVVDKTKRITLNEILAHPWLCHIKLFDHVGQGLFKDINLNEAILHKLYIYFGMSREVVCEKVIHQTKGKELSLYRLLHDKYHHSKSILPFMIYDKAISDDHHPAMNAVASAFALPTCILDEDETAQVDDTTPYFIKYSHIKYIHHLSTKALEESSSSTAQNRTFEAHQSSKKTAKANLENGEFSKKSFRWIFNMSSRNSRVENKNTTKIHPVQML